MSIFSSGEIRRRWSTLFERLPHVDAVVVSSFHNSYYLSGFPMVQWGRPAVTVLFRDSDPVLIIPAFEEEAAAANSPIADIQLYRDEQGPNRVQALSMAAQAITARGAQVIGYDGEDMGAASLTQLTTEFPDREFVDITETLNWCRLVCSPEEIAYLREGSRIADIGMQTVLDNLAVGVSEVDLAALAMTAMHAEASSDIEVVTNCYMQQGARSNLAHAGSLNVPIEAGQLLEVVCEVELFNYEVATERCILIGDVDPEVERAYDAMLSAFHGARDAVGPDVKFSEVDAGARKAYIEGGYADHWIAVGHGRSVIKPTGGKIEEGNIRPYNHRVMEPGMVLSVEPWAMTPGVGGPRHCDMVLVTDTGHEVWNTVSSGKLRIQGS